MKPIVGAVSAAGIILASYGWIAVSPLSFRRGPGQNWNSEWWINELGCRGIEISREKSDLYRIGTSGGSTTFGATRDRRHPLGSRSHHLLSRLQRVPLHHQRYSGGDGGKITVRAARPAGAEVALATFNMAVTPEGPEEGIRFYEPVCPDVRARMLANRLHARLVFEVAEAERALAIDTSSGLDGAYEDAYSDLIHLTQTGRDRPAANILDGIRGTLFEGASRSEPALTESDPKRPRA